MHRFCQAMKRLRRQQGAQTLTFFFYVPKPGSHYTLPPQVTITTNRTVEGARSSIMSVVRPVFIFAVSVLYLSAAFEDNVEPLQLNSAGRKFPVTISVTHEIQSGGRLPNVTVTWDTSEHPDISIDFFHVVICNPNQVCHIYSQKQRRLTPTGLQYWTNYTIQVIGVYNAKESLIVGGAGKYIVYTGDGAPFPPGSLHADFMHPTTIVLWWTNPKSTSSRNVTSYEVCVTLPRIKGSCVHSQVVPFEENGYEVKMEGFHLETTYSIYVKSVITDTSLGNFVSRPVRTSITTPSQRPGNVANVTFGVENITFAFIKWDESISSLHPHGGYLASCTSDAGVTNVSAVLDASETSVVLDLVEQLTSFNCCVSAFAHTGAKSKVHGPETCLNLITRGSPPPTDLFATPNDSTSVTLTWKVDKLLSNYSIEVIDDPENGYRDPKLLGAGREATGDMHTYTVGGLKPWTLYTFEVRNCAEYCSTGARVTARTTATAPSAVRNLRATVSDARGVTLEWEPPSDCNGPISGYIFSVLGVDSKEEVMHGANGNSTSVNISVSSEDWLYEAAVQAYNDVDGNTLRGPETRSIFYTPRDQRTPHFLWKNPVPNDSVVSGLYISVLRNESNMAFNITTVSETGAMSRLIPWTDYEEQGAGCVKPFQQNGGFEKTAVAGESEPTHMSQPFIFSTPTVVLIVVIAVIIGILIIALLTYRRIQRKQKQSVLVDAEEMDHRVVRSNSTTSTEAWNTNFLFRKT